MTRARPRSVGGRPVSARVRLGWFASFVALTCVASALPARAVMVSSDSDIRYLSHATTNLVRDAPGATSNTQITAFDEQQGVTIPAGGIVVDAAEPFRADRRYDQPGDFPATQPVLPAGTMVSSHVLHGDLVPPATG